MEDNKALYPRWLGDREGRLAEDRHHIRSVRGHALPFALLLRCVLFVPIALVGLCLMVTRYGGPGALRRPGEPR
jgi:hypothetical protein